MKFSNLFNLATKLSDFNFITGFVSIPVKAEKEADGPEHQEPVFTTCPEEEAEAHAIFAVSENGGREFLADAATREDADKLTSIFQAIYKAGRTHEDPNTLNIQWTAADIIKRGRILKIRVMPEEAQQILAYLKNDYDPDNGITSTNIDWHILKLQSRCWIKPERLENSGKIAAGKDTENYYGAIPFFRVNNNATMLIFSGNSWKEASADDFVFSNPYKARPDTRTEVS